MKIHDTKSGHTVTISGAHYLEFLADKDFSVTSYGYVGWNENGSHNFLHRHIMKAKAGEFVDHINNDGSVNLESNLRICSHAQNMTNRRKLLTGSSSKFKGVHLDTRYKLPRFRAVIRVNSKAIRLGTFDTEVEAAKAYDIASIKYHGEFGRTNEALGLFT